MNTNPFAGAGVTALGLAAARAVESGRSDRLIDDSFARRLFEAADADLPMRVEWPEDGSTLTDAEKLHLHGSRYIGLRTRVYDDFLVAGVAEGARQVVLLGAGLDTRARRLTLPADLALYEIDAPAVLGFKEKVLSDLGATPRCNLVSTETDLGGSWQSHLQEAGHRPDVPTVWIAEGVLPYLDAEQQAALVEAVADASPAGSSLAFDQVTGGDAGKLSQESGIDMKSLLQGVGGAGKLIRRLAESGWEVSEAGVTEVADRYGRDLSNPFNDGADPAPWLDTVFVTAHIA